MSYWFRDEAPAAVAVAPARTPVSQAQTQTRNIITQQYSNRSTNRSRGSTSTRSYVSSVNDLGGASRSATVRRRGGSSNIAKRATLDALAANQEKDLKQ